MYVLYLLIMNRHTHTAKHTYIISLCIKGHTGKTATQIRDTINPHTPICIKLSVSFSVANPHPNTYTHTHTLTSSPAKFSVSLVVIP